MSFCAFNTVFCFILLRFFFYFCNFFFVSVFYAFCVNVTMRKIRFFNGNSQAEDTSYLSTVEI